MDEIAVKAGISKKTLYNLFGDKEQLLELSVDYFFEQAKKESRAIVEDQEMDIVEKLKKIMLIIPNRNNEMNHQMAEFFKVKYPGLYQKISNNIEVEWRYMDRLIKLAIKQGRIRPVSIVVVRAMVEGAVERLLNSSVQYEEVDYETALKEMIDILLNGIRMNQ